MNPPIRRRDFLRTASIAGVGAGLVGPAACRGQTQSPAGAPNAEKLGWRLGCQLWSFNRWTFAEALEKVASLGLHYVEAFPGQRLSKERSNEKIGPEASSETRKEIKQRLADSGIKMVCFGVCHLGKDVDGSRRTFEFAREMGVEVLCSEPAEDALENLDRLCQEYQINLALHNHPRPSHYWDPDVVLRACKDRSRRIGACADTGHWMRSGIKPIEALKKLQGRIISFHFKDLNEFGRGAHDVPWGTGQGDAKGMLAEIRRQGLKAPFSIEYEHNWDNSLPEIAQCVAFFDKTAAELAK